MKLATRLVATLVLSLAAACGDDHGATLQSTGPALMTPTATLAAALEHHPTDHPSDREPVLLVHGTGSTPEETWGWNYVPTLSAMGFDVFTVRLPDRALADVQVSSEYVVYAIREIARSTGRKVDVIGHSQGGLEPRWALKWWPDIRELVDDFVALASPRDGTVVANAACVAGCGAAVWQVRYISNLLAALNRGDPAPGDTVSYTTILSVFDEIATPPVGLGANDHVADVLIQDLCPARPVDHISTISDAVSFAVVIDAITHPGPFDRARFDPATCLETTMPGVTPSMLVADGGPAAANAGLAIGTATFVSSEPPLRDYARGDAP